MSDIILKGISKSYGENTVFKYFDYTLAEGRISALLGVSGSGKTTLLNILAGLTGYSGEVLNAPADISYIFQTARLIGNLTVAGNLDYVLSSLMKDRNERRKRINDILNLVELKEFAGKYPQELSGGMAQRVAIARAFAYPSEFLVMDEPFKGLDIGLKKRLTDAFLKLWSQDKRTVIYVTHDIDEALLLADNVTVISGKPAEIAFYAEVPGEKLGRSLADPALNTVREGIYKALLK